MPPHPPHHQHQNLPEGCVLQLALTHKMKPGCQPSWMVPPHHHPSDGLPPPLFLGWSSTIENVVTHHPKDDYPASNGWLTSISRMVTHHPKDGHPPSKRWSQTIPRMVTHSLKDSHPTELTLIKIYQKKVHYRPCIWHLYFGHPPSPGMVYHSNIQRLVTHHPKFAHQPSQGWSPSFQQMATHHSQNGHPPS